RRPARPPDGAAPRGRLRLDQLDVGALPRRTLRRLQGLRDRPRGEPRRAPLVHADEDGARPPRLKGAPWRPSRPRPRRSRSSAGSSPSAAAFSGRTARTTGSGATLLRATRTDAASG